MSARSCLLAALLLLAAPIAQAGDYTQAPGSTLVFYGNFQGERFQGQFPGFATRMSFDPSAPGEGWLEVVIPLATATLGVDEYDGELRGPAFFDSARFNQARYSARGFRSLGGGRFAADGSLSLRGISKPVTLEFSWTPGASPVLEGKATVRRLEFGVGGGDWAATETIEDAVAIETRVLLKAAD